MNPFMSLALDGQLREVTLEHAAGSAPQHLYCPYCGIQVLFICATGGRPAHFSPVAGLRHESNCPHAPRPEGLLLEKTLDWREWRQERQREIEEQRRREQAHQEQLEERLSDKSAGEEAHQSAIEIERQRQERLKKEKERKLARSRDNGLEL
jgi:hypothetical protein